MRIRVLVIAVVAVLSMGFVHVDEGKAIVGVLQVERIDRGVPDPTLQKQLDDARARLDRADDDRQRSIAKEQVAQLESRVDESRPVFLWGVIYAPKEEPVALGVWVDGKRSSRCKDIEVGDFIRVSSSTDRRNWNMPDGERQKPTDRRIIAFTINDVREVSQPESWPSTVFVSRPWETADEEAGALVTLGVKIGAPTFESGADIGNGLRTAATNTYPIRVTNEGERAIAVLRCNAVILDRQGFPLFERRGIVERGIAPGAFFEFEHKISLGDPRVENVRIDVCYAEITP